jgi:predicted ATPase/DNA-binding SARP family transcriptional activator
MPHLTLSLLGGFQAQLDDRPLDGFQSNKVRSLLIYLAVEADRPHSRAKLAGLFWANLPEKRALTYLRHALANLRKILGDADSDDQATQPFLRVTPQTLQFNRQSDCRLDVADLLAALDRSAADSLPAREAALKGGDRPFLDGFFLNDCPAFEEWMLLFRERLQRRVLTGLQSLADAYTRLDDYSRAADFARRGVDLDPWREEGHRQLIQLLALSGQRSAALAQYDVCRHLLRQEFDVEPGAETTALYRAIVAGEFDNAPSPTAPLPPAVPPHNLPTPLTPLVGRAETIRAVQKLLSGEEARLVTLTGPGGVGKTRLSLAVAEKMRDSFPDGVYFVELASVREADFVLPALAEAVIARHTRNDTPLLQQMIDHFHNQAALLVLDNFEHVLEAGTQIAKLLAGSPQLKVLATSRISLRLRGEFAFVVPPLTVSEEALPTGALELFRQRAQAANQYFVLDQTNSSLAAALCTRLDGLPLAIELAAARLKYDSLPTLFSSLSAEGTGASLALLKAELQDVPERQRSLWATIAWSYDLLDAPDQRLFRRLAVFVGGWTGEAAQAVCGLGLALSVADGLHRLVDAHLISLNQNPATGPRFGMLETIREFGLAQLQGSGELLAIQHAHALFYRNLVERLEPHLRSAAQTQTEAYLRAEYPNIRSALTWAIGQQEVDISLSLCDSLHPFWNSHAAHEALPLLEAALAVAEGTPPSVTYVHALVSAGYFAYVFSRQPKGRRYFENALAMNEAIGGQGSGFKIGVAYGLLRRYQLYAGEYEAAAAMQEAIIAHAYRAEDEWNLAIVLANSGQDFALQGQLEKGARMAKEGLALFRRIGDPWGLGLALCRLGVIYRLMDTLKEAKAYLLEAEKTSNDAGSDSHMNSIKREMALIALEEGDVVQAAILAREALRLARESKIADTIADTLHVLVQVTGSAGEYEHSLSLAAFLVHYFEEKGELRLPW